MNSDVADTVATCGYIGYGPHCYIHMLGNMLVESSSSSTSEPTQNALIPSPYKDPIEILKQVHNARMGHHGVRICYSIHTFLVTEFLTKWSQTSYLHVPYVRKKG